MNFKWFRCLVVGVLAFAGCASDDISMSRRVDVDDESFDGGISSADMRTVASRMCPSVLSAPGVVSRQPPVRIKMGSVRNTSRFFIDGDMFARMLRMELNKFGAGRIRFLAKAEKTSAGDEIESDALVLMCEISSLSQALNGMQSDFLVVALQLVDSATSEIVWEDSYEVKRMSRTGIVYR